MKTARFNAPLALVRDRFILVLGGFVSKHSTTKMTECYDTQLNHWFTIQSLPTSVVNATAVTMNERFVCLMPGQSKESGDGSSIQINLLDTGSSSLFTGDRNTRSHGRVIANQKWQQLEVKNPEFIQARPCAGIQSSSSEMLIFGGESVNSFTFDTRDVAQIGGVANIKPSKVQMSTKAHFGVQSDYVARTFGSWIYLIDGKDRNLHVYSITNQTWNSQALGQLGIE